MELWNEYDLDGFIGLTRGTPWKINYKGGDWPAMKNTLLISSGGFAAHNGMPHITIPYFKINNFPIGISSINYMLLCTFALFIRARTLLPNLLYDWGFFIIAILIISSLHYTILTIVFDMPIRYGTLMFSSILTFLVYPLFSKLFK